MDNLIEDVVLILVGLTVVFIMGLAEGGLVYAFQCMALFLFIMFFGGIFFTAFIMALDDMPSDYI